LDNGKIIYSEINKTSRQQGNLFFTNVSGTVNNIKNSNLSDEDSLLITLQGKLMDSADIVLSVKESYADSLSGFLLSAKVSAADMCILNPVLVPLSNIKITSGILDSLSLTAVGRRNVALGEMNMHYRKLRIQLIKNGDPDKSSFLQHLLGFFSNTFIIKSSNTSRKGIMYYNRSAGQSFINYIAKLTLSGVSSSIGLKKNRKYLKQYKKDIKEGNLPPVQLNAPLHDLKNKKRVSVLAD
jgi:hypothetical protein